MNRKAVWTVLGIMLIGASCMAASAGEESAVNAGRRALELSMGLEWAPQEIISGEEAQTAEAAEILYVEIQPGSDAQDAAVTAGNRNVENQANDNQTGIAAAGMNQQLNGQQPENQQNDLPDNSSENENNASAGASDNGSNPPDASAGNNGSSEGGGESSGGSPNNDDNNSSGGAPEEGGSQPDDTDDQEGEDDPIENPDVSGGDL